MNPEAFQNHDKNTESADASPDLFEATQNILKKAQVRFTSLHENENLKKEDLPAEPKERGAKSEMSVALKELGVEVPNVAENSDGFSAELVKSPEALAAFQAAVSKIDSSEFVAGAEKAETPDDEIALMAKIKDGKHKTSDLISPEIQQMLS